MDTSLKSGNTIDLSTAFPWEALCVEVMKLQVQRHERDQRIWVPPATSTQNESPVTSEEDIRGLDTSLTVEAAGIEPTPGGAQLPAESRPYLVTARNAWESSSRRVPSCPAPFQPIPHAPATYVQHGGDCTPPTARPFRAV
jgi:hypothetical protein